MAASSQITVTNVAYVAVIASSFCKSITIQEAPNVVNWPTTGYEVKVGSQSSTPIPVNPGAAFPFENGATFFKPGDIAGYVQTNTGTTTFNQVEDVGWSQGRTF